MAVHAGQNFGWDRGSTGLQICGNDATFTGLAGLVNVFATFLRLGQYAVLRRDRDREYDPV
jgi:hypothetical protein